jgi:hypothetical protein
MSDFEQHNAEIVRLTARVEQLEAALRPFAKAAECAEDDEPEYSTLYSSSARHRITLGDLFRASAALAPEQDR